MKKLLYVGLLLLAGGMYAGNVLTNKINDHDFSNWGFAKDITENVFGKVLGTTSSSHVMPDGSIMDQDGNVISMSMDQMMLDMNKSLEGKEGDDFDKEFLKQMIIHHEGAVEMAKQVQEKSKRPELLKLANDIITAQTSEINTMKGWQTAWFK